MNTEVNTKTKIVTLYSEILASEVASLLMHFGLIIKKVDNQEIPGSYWGESEAGLISNTLYIRDDTPVHSLLHEACHYICMDKERRESLNTDAGGDYDEENAVCYLQILLSDKLTHFSRQIMFNDMDNWGYTFRLGSARKWFETDAQEAKDWLIHRNIIKDNEQLHL